MFTNLLQSVLVAFIVGSASPDDTPQQVVPDAAVQLQNAATCATAGPLFNSIYEFYEQGIQRVIVEKALLDQIYDALPGRPGAELAAVVKRSINILYSAKELPDRVSWFYLTQLYCVNMLGSDLEADQRPDVLGLKSKQKGAGVEYGK